MNKHRLTIISIVLFVTMFVLAGCVNTVPGTPHQSALGIPDRLTTEEEKIIRFSDVGLTNLQISKGYANGAPFGCF